LAVSWKLNVDLFVFSTQTKTKPEVRGQRRDPPKLTATETGTKDVLLHLEQLKPEKFCIYSDIINPCSLVIIFSAVELISQSYPERLI